MPSWKLVLEYDGSRYRGWQEQSNARSVAGEVRQAAETLCGARVELQAAGRTDAGVHALGQVAHLRTAGAGRLELTAINQALPADIAVRRLGPAPPRFHARHDAVARRYVYCIAQRKSAFGKKHSWWIKPRLDVAAMRAAAAGLAGRRDFTRFRAADPAKEAASTIVRVGRAEFHERAGLLLFRIEASHFLWKMVRRLVGALAQVGQGTLPVDVFLAQLEPAPAPDLPIAEWTAPASGLFLEHVQYPGEPPAGPEWPALFPGSV